MSRGTTFPTIVYAPSEDSDQPAHPHSPTSLRSPPEEHCEPWLPTEGPVKTDQTAWMRRLS